MAMSPLGPAGPPSPKVPLQFQGGHPGGARSPSKGGRDGVSDGSAEERAAAARRQALDQTAQVERQVEDTRRQGEKTVETLKDQYERRSLEEESRQELALETQRNKGYEHIREVQRAQAAELDRVKREGDKALGNAENYYRQAVHNTRRSGEQRLNEEMHQTGTLAEFEKRASAEQLERAQIDNRGQLETGRMENEARLLKLKEEGNQRFTQLSETSQRANEQAEANYRQKFAQTSQMQNESLGKIYKETNEQLHRARESGARNLAAYSERNRDPFYRMVDLDADLYDLGDKFVLTATIPLHEQEHIGVSVKNDQLVLTGSRRNEEKIDLGEGHARGTAAYQSFSESFRLDYPVEPRQIRKEFDGERLMVIVPKYQGAQYKPKARPEPQRAKVERPHFPDNLPVDKYEKRIPEEDEVPHLAEKDRGSAPLSRG